uniref:Uncharacterized protein n=1 Tax=Cryptomonas curvata TaxID=233186 RepID=A0A7S0Q9F3_9CRYP|mmetsp:Transcript_14162/g.30260  ORF Transcript_14162/g.30260 Transcript_14162/m.30260 type:complete len:165 (+) Transcript_14162:22-516(+)
MSTYDQAEDEQNLDLENILERLDASVKGKFERCADISWCTVEENASSSCVKKSARLAGIALGKSARHRNSAVDVCRKSKFVRKIARKLESLNPKISKLKTPRRVVVASPVADRPADEQIRRGSNTPANSRPCSISMTMDQIENDRWKHSDFNGPNSCSISCGAS